MGTEIHSTEHLECLSLAPNTRELRKRHVGTLNHHWNWALALGIILHWDPLILCEFRWNCHQQDKCIWRTWPCRTGLTLLMLCIKCWVWKILPEVQMCLSIRDISLVLLMQMLTFLKKKKGGHFFLHESFWHNSFPVSQQASVQAPPQCGARVRGHALLSSEATQRDVSLQSLLLTSCSSLLWLFNNFMGLCWKLGHWKDPVQSRKMAKNYLFWTFLLTQIISVMQHSGRDGGGICSLSSYTEPDRNPG